MFLATRDLPARYPDIHRRFAPGMRPHWGRHPQLKTSIDQPSAFCSFFVLVLAIEFVKRIREDADRFWQTGVCQGGSVWSSEKADIFAGNLSPASDLVSDQIQ
jgi:hypothetical protein